MSCKLIKCEAERGLPNSKICTFAKKVWELSRAELAGTPRQRRIVVELNWEKKGRTENVNIEGALK
jgi:hypothetical protein